jgi:hypothetical protein
MVFQHDRLPESLHTEVWKFLKWKFHRNWAADAVISLGYLIPLILHKIISSSGGITCTRGCFFILPLSITGWACKGMVYNLLQLQLQVHVYKCMAWTWKQISHTPDYSECSDWMSVNCQAHITESWSIIYPTTVSFIFISASRTPWAILCSNGLHLMYSPSTVLIIQWIYLCPIFNSLIILLGIV